MASRPTSRTSAPFIEHPRKQGLSLAAAPKVAGSWLTNGYLR